MRRNVDMHTHLKLFYLIEAHFVISKNLIIKVSKFLMRKEVCVYIFYLGGWPQGGVSWQASLRDRGHNIRAGDPLSS